MAILLVAVLAVSCFVLVNDSDESDAFDSATSVTLSKNGNGSDYVTLDSEHTSASGTNWTAQFNSSKATLTITDDDGSAGDPAHTLYNSYYEFATGKYALLYANGNLNIVIQGSSTLLWLNSSDAADKIESYGIYVDGNLTIENKGTVERTVKITTGDEGSHYGAKERSAGIYCAGEFNLNNSGSQKFTVIVNGAPNSYDSEYASASGNAGKGYKTYGVHAVEGIGVASNVVLDASGGNISYSTKAGTTCSLGILSGSYVTNGVEGNYNPNINGQDVVVGSGGKIIAKGGDINNSYDNSTASTSPTYTVSAGIGCGSMTVKGSKMDYDPDDISTVAVKATGGGISKINALSGAGGKSYGIWTTSLTVSGGNVVSDGGIVNLGIGPTACHSYGLFANGSVMVSASGKLFATGGESYKFSYGIYVPPPNETSITVTGYVEARAGFVVSTNSFAGESTGIYAYGDLVAVNGTVVGRGGVSCQVAVVPIGIDVQNVSLMIDSSVSGYGGTVCTTYAGEIYEFGSGGNSTGTVKDTIGVRLRGNNHIIGTASGDGAGSSLMGIGGALNSLQFSAAVPGATYGVMFSNDGAITVRGNGTITATGGTTQYNPFHDQDQGNLESIGLYSKGALSLNRTTVNATGGNVCSELTTPSSYGSISRGMFVNSDLTLSGGSTVNATGGRNLGFGNYGNAPYYNDSYGLSVNGNISVTGSTLNATAGKASRMIGVIVSGSLTMSGGSTVEVTSDESIRAENECYVISRAILTNLSLGGSAYGIVVEDGIDVDAGTFISTAQEAAASYNCILEADHIAINAKSYAEIQFTHDDLSISGSTFNYIKAISPGYAVAFNGNGAEGSMSGTTYMGVYELPESGFTTPYGYRFVGWMVGSTSEPAHAAGTTIKVVSDTVLYAKWEELPKYDISFTNTGGLNLSVKIGDADARALTDGEITAGKITAIPEGTEVKFTAAAITGYDLFYQANDGEVTALGTGYQFTVSGACSIAFTKAPHKYTATFNLSGGTVASTPSGWAGSDGVYTKDFDYDTPKAAIISDFGAYSKVGHTKGAETASADTMGVDGMTITATWTPIKYTATFNLSGGTVASTPTGWAGSDGVYTKDFDYGTPKADIIDDFGDYSKVGHTKGAETVSVDTMGVDGMSITANWTPIKYAITFLNYNGDELQSETLLYGTMPEYKGNTPTKASTAQYSYNFAGWDSEIVSVTGDATYTATYGSTVNKYTIRFVNYDGTQLQSGQVNYGAIPTYTGATPTKPSDAQYDYAFAGWDNAIVSVISDATYMATYDSSLRSYTIRFVNYNETELQSGSVAYGSTPVYSGATPKKDADDYFTYTFAGWDPAIVEVTGAATYTATFDSARIPYTISFATTEGGSGSMANVVVDSGDYVLPANSFTPAAGKVFEGWAYGSASGQVYLANAHCDIHENVTFYAKWSDHQHTLVSIPAVPATCTESGLTEGFRCSECGQIIVAQVTVDALGHDHVAVVTEPTCTTGGYTTHTCSRCGDSYVDDEVPALGHSWGEWQITRAPTCTQAGEKTRTCAHDGTHTETESIPVIDHDYVAVVTAPTCTEKGFTTHTCSMCGDSYVDTYVDELGHTWASAEYTWSADGKTCTVIVICGTDNHRQTVPDVAVTSSVKTAATTSSMGVTAYAVNGIYQGFAYSSTKDVSDIPALEAAPTVKEGTSTYENEVAENVETAVTNTFSTAKDAGGDVALTVPTTAAGSMTIVFDNAAVNAIGGNEVSLQATVKENVAEIADAALVIEVTLSGATFSDGKAKVSVPFSQTVPEGKTLKVYFINGNERQDMNATLVDGKVVFETNHFSTYAVVFEDAPSSSSNGGGFPIWIIFVIIAVVAAAGAGAFFIIKQKKA